MNEKDRVTFVEAFGVDPLLFQETGAFNPVLNADSDLYIDPALVRKCDVSEFIDAKETITKYFDDIVRIIRTSAYVGDSAWNMARGKLIFKEIKGTCLGYSKTSTGGNSIGKKFSDDIIKIAKELIDSGDIDPIVFEFANIFKEGIGSDRISDMITNITIEHIYRFTDRVVKQIGTAPNVSVTYKNNVYGLVVNPYNKEPILLLPYSILSKLPLVESMRNIVVLCNTNMVSRAEMEKYVSLDDKKLLLTKSSIYSAFLSSPEFRNLLINAYAKGTPRYYDPSWESLLLCVEQSLKKSSGGLQAPQSVNSLDDLILIVDHVNNVFSSYIEDVNFSKLLYETNDEKKPISEKKIQMIYRIFADFICKPANIDVSPEADGGRGPVDFKFSHGPIGNI